MEKILSWIKKSFVTAQIGFVVTEKKSFVMDKKSLSWKKSFVTDKKNFLAYGWSAGNLNRPIRIQQAGKILVS